MTSRLFRQAALDFQLERNRGDTLQITAPGSGSITVLISGIFAFMLLFLSICDYHRKEKVGGILLPDNGIISIRPPENGRISGIFVRQNHSINAGENLFELLIDERYVSDRLVSEEMLENITERERNFSSRMQLEAERFHYLRSDHQKSIENTRDRIRRLLIMLENKKTLLALKMKAYESAKQLNSRKLIAETELDSLYGEVITQEIAVDQIEMEIEESRRKLNELEDEAYIAELNEKLELIKIDNERGLLNRELINLEANKSLIVKAPFSGEISLINSHVGEFVNVQNKILDIIPDNSSLQAELFVPGRAIGFLSKMQEVNIRIEAFPYRKFGVLKGRITKISDSVVHPEEIPRETVIREPVYRVIAELEKSPLSAGEDEITLKSGMLLDATLILEDRSLLEWLIEPVLSISG